MPLVNAKCTNCGGTLSVDASKDAAICDFCGSPFIVEKAIQNYNYYVTQNIKADNINVTAKGEAEKERLLHNAETYTSFKDYDKALDIYKQITEDYPDDYRAWYGMASIDTEEFKKVDLSADEFQQVCSLMDKALMTATNQKAEIEAEWKIYLANRLYFLKQKKAELAQLESQISENRDKIKTSNRIIKKSKHENAINKRNKSITNIIVVCIVAFGGGIIGILNDSGYHNELLFIIIAVVSILSATIIKIKGVSKESKAKKAKVQRQNTINEEYNNIQNYNQCVSMISGKITEMKSRYNI